VYENKIGKEIKREKCMRREQIKKLRAMKRTRREEIRQ